MAFAYLAGAVLSAIAGKIGVMVAALSNARCAEGADKGIRPAFLIGFRGGAVMGLAVVGISLFGVAGILPPATSALLHNAYTLTVSLRSMTRLLPPAEIE